MSVGGGGGGPLIGGQAGSKGFPDHGGGLPGTPDAMDCSAGSGGRIGANAPNIQSGTGALTLGSVSGAGWQPASGTDGETGAPGQGGGGGASLNENGRGGGGGCGSCGGNGGIKGLGGGASISLLAFDSQVVVSTAALIAGAAGSGGNGHVGQQAQTDVGAGGNALSSLNSCNGGNGGRGGDGGASGGGAGGISVGILWAGEQAPDRSEVTFEFGTPGEGGLGGEPGVNDGIDGVALDVFEAP
jgi:hypothetical protein